MASEGWPGIETDDWVVDGIGSAPLITSEAFESDVLIASGVSEVDALIASEGVGWGSSAVICAEVCAKELQKLLAWVVCIVP